MAKKVFELAKELDLNSLEVVEKLRIGGVMVRNHMAALSDEELVQAMAILKPVATQTAATVKKVVKKAAVKKTSATEAPKTQKSAGTKEVKATKNTAVEAEDVSKKKVDTKKAVIRRKTSKVEEHEATEQDVLLNDSSQEFEASEQNQETEVEQVVSEQESRQAEEETVEADSVVEQVEVVEPAAQEVPEVVVKAEQNEVKPTTKAEEVKPKKSGLRIVSMPEAPKVVPKKAKPEATTSTVASTAIVEEDDEDGRDKKNLDEKSTKKRLGGLASMMSGKKPLVSRAQTVLETRSELELKSYAALSGLGRPIYTPVKKKKQYAGPAESTALTEMKESKRVIYVHDGCTIEELTSKLSQKFQSLADRCLHMNLLVKPTDYVGLGLASEIAAMYGYRVENKAFDEKLILDHGKAEVVKSDLPLRSPIITIMGHVDHGKTTLLDTIRKAKVVSTEAGGITQHIGAYTVNVNGKILTFLDTPGHAAFAAMRQRGADVTDIVVLVVAADDGVMPQTRESINFCKQAKKPVIVAVNKMDKEGVNPDRIKSALAELELTPEDWGGETQFVHISALKGDGVDNLLESIALQSEIMELRADPKGRAEGVVIESKIEQGRGPVATILVQSGTLEKGDSIVVGEVYGRCRSLVDHTGKSLESAGPSTPVQVLGIDGIPNPGDKINVVKNEREAKKIVDNRIAERKLLENAPGKKKVTLEDFFSQSGNSNGEGEKKVLNLLIRSDVQGSFEAIKGSLEAFNNNEVEVKVIGGGVGPITDNDVNFAIETTSIIFGFNMRPMTSARRLAEERGIEVKTYSIIYELINDVKLAIEGMLRPDMAEEFIGRAEVRNVFPIPKIGTIAGSYVVDGKIQMGCSIRLLRSGKIVFDGKLSSLKRFKDDAKEVKSGYECGMTLENFNDIKVGDIFEAYSMVERKRTLEEVQKAEASAAVEA
jgi:translation initiation factor IF-2